MPFINGDERTTAALTTICDQLKSLHAELDATATEDQRACQRVGTVAFIAGALGCNHNSIEFFTLLRDTMAYQHSAVCPCKSCKKFRKRHGIPHPPKE